MLRGLVALLTLVAVALAAPAQPPEVPPIALTLRPAAPPVPAMKYHLLPELSEQTQGNAIVHYTRAMLLQGKEIDGEHPLWKWLEMPLSSLPRAEVRNFVDEHRSMYHELELAARCERCDWQLTGQLRTEGINLLLPEIQRMRAFASLLNLRIRLEIAEGHPDQALRTLQVGFVLARHVNGAPTLISALVACAITAIMANQLDELIQAPGAPNLYWALTYLRRPFIDLHRSMESERLWVEGMFPGLRELTAGPRAVSLSAQQLQVFMDKLTTLARAEDGKDSWLVRFELTAHAAKVYPDAKRALLGQGWTTAQIEAMPLLQALFLYDLNQYDRVFDDVLKYLGLPYYQARPALLAHARRFKEARANDAIGDGILATLLLPAVEKVYFAQARVDRKIASLRTIEALRLHAAANGGRLPDRLDAITAVPVPIDPVTGKSFEYVRKGDTATLTGPPPAGEDAREGNTLKYTLTLKP